MAQDFANGQRRKRDLRRNSPVRQRRSGSAFHPGSFGAGIALGIAFTLAGALLPQWWSSGVVKTQAPIAPVNDAAPVTRFEFFERLPNERVTTPAAPSRADNKTPVTPQPREYLLQAGSFTAAEDAERLRSTLQTKGFRTEVAIATLSNGAVRHRVIVGPFAPGPETQRALTALRDQDIEALMLVRKPASG